MSRVATPGTLPEGGSGRRLRRGLAVAILVAGSLASSSAVFRFGLGLRLEPGQLDEVSRAERRFRPVRSLLPRTGVVGYLSDRPDDVEAYYLAQYALAPLVLRPGGAGEVVLGNFFDPAAGPPLARAAGLDVAADLGQGLLVLRRRLP